MRFIRRWFIRFIIVGIIVAGLIVGSILLGIVSGDDILRGIQRVFNPAPRASITSPATIIRNIRLLGMLETINIEASNPNVQVDIEQGFLNACGFSASHEVKGTVEAGVNLEFVSEADLAYDENTDLYTLTLPATQLTSCRVDELRQYNRSTTTCGDFDLARDLASAQAIVLFRDQALENGILDKAEQQAVRILKDNLAGLIGDSTLTIEFSADGPAMVPDSCQTSSPNGWRYDEVTGTWTPPG